jgi:hypothetical protein
LAFDLQVNYLSFDTPSGRTATGVGYAPAVQGRLNGGQQSTPYVALGWLHGSLSLENVTSSASGVFANAGYEWRWESGLGILLGGGIAHIGAIRATDGISSVSTRGGWFPLIETGLRYMFF